MGGGDGGLGGGLHVVLVSRCRHECGCGVELPASLVVVVFTLSFSVQGGLKGELNVSRFEQLSSVCVKLKRTNGWLLINTIKAVFEKLLNQPARRKFSEHCACVDQHLHTIHCWMF